MNCDAGNDDITILNPLLGLLCVRKYDKTGVQFVQTLPISATSPQSTRTILITGESVECGDHDFSFENLTLSATLQINLTKNPVESIFSVREYDNRQIYVSVHNYMMDFSNGIKHVANFYRIMRGEAEMATLGIVTGGVRPTPYFVLLGCYGGPDYNLGRLANQISIFVLFLVGNMDKLVAERVFPGISYLNTS